MFMYIYININNFYSLLTVVRPTMTHVKQLKYFWLPTAREHNYSSATYLRNSSKHSLRWRIFTSWGSFSPETTKIFPPVQKFEPNRRSQIIFKRLEIDKKCQQNTNTKLGSFFQNLESIFTCSAPRWDFAMTSFPVYNKSSIYTKWCKIDAKLQ